MRISKRSKNVGTSVWITSRLVHVHKTLVSASKCASLGSNVWLTKGGGYLISDGSEWSRQIKKMMDEEVGKPHHKVIGVYEEDGVYNFHVEMKVAGSEVEVLANGGSWRKKQGSSAVWS